MSNNNLKANANPQLEMQQQQQKMQQNFEAILRTRMSNEKTNITDLISDEQFEKLKTIIQIQFGLQPASKYKTSNESFLDLYERLFEKDETEFNMMEFGTISDMLYVDCPMREEFEIELKEFLEFKVEMTILPKTYHEKMDEIRKTAERELKAKTERKIIT